MTELSEFEGTGLGFLVAGSCLHGVISSLSAVPHARLEMDGRTAKEIACAPQAHTARKLYVPLKMEPPSVRGHLSLVNEIGHGLFKDRPPLHIKYGEDPMAETAVGEGSHGKNFQRYRKRSGNC